MSLVARPRLPRWIGLVPVALAFLLMTVWTWRKWPDVLVDFGLQLYLPWQLAAGKLLCRDVMYLSGGPLSQYYNACLFRWFGVSLTTLIVSNLLLLAVLVLVLYRFFEEASDWVAATVISLVVLLVFSFSEYVEVGNYNYVCPYSHDAFHGLLLSVFTLAFLTRWIQTKKIGKAATAGFCFGLVFLTKPDLFLAITVATTAAFYLSMNPRTSSPRPSPPGGERVSDPSDVALAKAEGPVRGLSIGSWPQCAPKIASRLSMNLPTSGPRQEGNGLRTAVLRRPLLSAGAAFLLFAAIPALAFFGFYSREVSAAMSLRSVAWAWIPLLTTAAAKNDFYRWSLGLDAPQRNIALMLAHAAGVCLVVALYAACCRGFSRRSVSERAALAALMAVLSVASYFYPWLECGRALPILIVTVVAVAFRSWRRQGSPAFGRGLVFPWLWSVFGLVLLAKMGFSGRIWHYGFYLAMPAAIACVYFLCGILPRWFQQAELDGAIFRVAIIGTLAIGTFRLVSTSGGIYQLKNYPVGDGADKIIAYHPDADARSYGVNLTLAWLKSNAPPEATLAVLPEGVMLNYLSRRTNPTPYTAITPAEVQAYGEENMLAAYQANRPDYIILIHRDSSEFGVGYFGQTPEFGRSTLRWIKQHYQPVYLIGHEPLQTNLFGIQILKRE